MFIIYLSLIRCTFGRLAGLGLGEFDESIFGENIGDDAPNAILGDRKKDLTVPKVLDNLELPGLLSYCRKLIVPSLGVLLVLDNAWNLDPDLHLLVLSVSFSREDKLFEFLIYPGIQLELNSSCRFSFKLNFTMIVLQPRIINVHTRLVKEI